MRGKVVDLFINGSVLGKTAFYTDGIVDLIDIVADNDLELTARDLSAKNIQLFNRIDIDEINIFQVEAKPGHTVKTIRHILLAAHIGKNLFRQRAVVRIFVRHKGNLLFFFRLPECDRETAAAQGGRCNIRQLCHSVFIGQTGVLQGEVKHVVLKFAQTGVFFSADQRKKLFQKLLTIHRGNLHLWILYLHPTRTRASPERETFKKSIVFTVLHTVDVQHQVQHFVTAAMPAVVLFNILRHGAGTAVDIRIFAGKLVQHFSAALLHGDPGGKPPHQKLDVHGKPGVVIAFVVQRDVKLLLHGRGHFVQDFHGG